MNTSHTPIDESLLAKYILQEADAHERMLVEQWIDAGPLNKKRIDDLRKIIERSMIETDSSVNEYEALERLHKRIENNTTAKTIRLNRNTFILRIAAVLIVAISATLVIYNRYLKEPEWRIVQSTETPFTQELPDGSTVVLNKNSSIEYPEIFNGNERKITLKGEAFFSVNPDKAKPFIIKANDVSVKVLGTSFNVRQRNGSTSVIVRTGIVEVSRGNENVQLQAGERADLSFRKTIMKEKNQNTLYDYYFSEEIVCNRTPLHELVAILNEKFNSNILIGNQNLRNLPISTTFRNESLEDILQVISTTFNIRILREDGKIILN